MIEAERKLDYAVRVHCVEARREATLTAIVGYIVGNKVGVKVGTKVLFDNKGRRQVNC